MVSRPSTSCSTSRDGEKRSRSKQKKKRRRRRHRHSKSPAFDASWVPVAVIAARYAMGPKIGSGSFGSVHAGVDLQDDHRFLAIKLEPVKPNHHPQLEKEFKIYRAVHGHPRSTSTVDYQPPGVPRVFHFGRVDGHEYNAMVLEMM